MVTGTLLPFPVGGANAAPRTLAPAAPNRDDFAGAMDDALAARPARRADYDARAPRRNEPAKPRETADSRPAATSRRTSSGERPAAKKTEGEDQAVADDAAADRSGDTSPDSMTATDQPGAPRDAKTGGDATEPTGEETGETADANTAACAAEEAVAAPADALTDEDDNAATAGDDPLARGRRWTTAAAERADEHSETAPNGVARGGAGAAGRQLKTGHAIQQARADAAAAPGQPLADIAKEVVASAHAEADATGAAEAPVTQAVETTHAAPRTTANADAMTAIENAISAVETVAGAEPSAGTNTGGSETHEQPQPKPQAASSQASTAAVAMGTPSEGVRFTVTGAAGNAAYANAAPRSEEAAVLPQIVQSIRLHAVQGTTEARVQLRPEHLGVLNITLKVEQNQVTATIQADVAAVRAWIESHESSLRQALSEQGLHLAKLVVHEDGQQASKDERDGDRPRRQPRRRSWRDQDATFEVLA